MKQTGGGFKSRESSAVIVVTDNQSQATAKVLKRLVPHWKWEVADDCSRLSEDAYADVALGIIILPQILDHDVLLWTERVTQACPRQLWIAVVDERHCCDPHFMRTVAATCHDFVIIPLDDIAGLLSGILGHAAGLARLRSQVLGGPSGNVESVDMVGQSQPMKQLGKLIAKFARVDSPILIRGESGTGKELVARAIHRASARVKGPFIAVNCGAIPENLVESELFGHVKGAFTGAVQDRTGRAELADGGTLFLDEIGDLPLSHQVKILRFLQEGCFERVGSPRSTQVDVRIVAATHLDLEAGIKAQTFREDLFYRLNVLQIRVPSLRERGEDIASLAEYFLARMGGNAATVARDFSADALLALRRHHWPGNVRELINRVSKAAIMAETSLITPVDLDLPNPRALPTPRIVNLQQARERAERQAIEHALRDSNYNVSQAASILGVSRMTIYRLLEKHCIEID